MMCNFAYYVIIIVIIIIIYYYRAYLTCLGPQIQRDIIYNKYLFLLTILTPIKCFKFLKLHLLLKAPPLHTAFHSFFLYARSQDVKHIGMEFEAERFVMNSMSFVLHKIQVLRRKSTSTFFPQASSVLSCFGGENGRRSFPDFLRICWRYRTNYLVI